MAKLTIAYDGTDFAGWAKQPGERTVQAELEHALFRVHGEREPITLTVAGRTDAGVHATGQVASYPGPPVPKYGLNRLLPEDISVVDCAWTPDGFDARRDARARSYRYRLLARRIADPFERGRALHVPTSLDEEAMSRATAAMIGQHDFTAFTPTETVHTRFERTVLAAEWQRESESILVLTVTADAFMRNMVRTLVGTLLEVGRGERSTDEFTALLEGRRREEAGPTAPPHGLYFAAAHYDDDRRGSP
jgi:tRNA pseudouridine38-40 synthase